jgi:CRISPR-associated endonuclease/helicase Cas3
MGTEDQAGTQNTQDHIPSPFFWAKTTVDGHPGISVLAHMLNVGCVARCLVEAAPELLGLFQLRTNEVGTLVALHDLGKICPGFQRKCEEWLETNGIAKIARNGLWDTVMESNHGKVTQAAVFPFLVSHGMPVDTAQYAAAIMGSHHGRLQALPDTRGLRLTKKICEDKSGIDWQAAREAATTDVLKAFPADVSKVILSESSPSLWWMAGLTTVADWIGSDEHFFSPLGGVAVDECMQIAQTAVNSIGFGASKIEKGLMFADLFKSRDWTEPIPNDMQKKTIEAINGPGVYVVESPMGTGKTEAALWAAYKMLSAGMARGIYFALPTQATSNRMHLRMADFVQRIAPDSKRTRLIHGNSWLFDLSLDYRPAPNGKNDERNDARAGYDWFASAKRALLAPFGVGTVDQALLGVVAAKHFFVRHFALAGKVVILDEVHSYDLYTGTLIDRLVDVLEDLGCTVIILSATLTGKRRAQIVPLEGDDSDHPAQLPYPIISGRTKQRPLIPVPAEPPSSREVDTVFLKKDAASAEAIDLASRGGAVLWICDTVDTAQNQYRELIERSKKRFRVGLLHSRFPFWRREELENDWMECLGKDGSKRCASILVSTQIVEQSVDLDADLIVTELAPTDMLLQRMGRLWRHSREIRPIARPRFCILEEEAPLSDFRTMDAKSIIRTLGAKASVYAPYVLLRSLQVWESQAITMIPGDIRDIIEATYGDGDDEPEAWQDLFDERYSRALVHKQLAFQSSNIWSVSLNDEEGIQTRLDETPTIPVVLCVDAGKRNARFIDGEEASLNGAEFVFGTAQAIHRNLVKVPEYVFEKDAVESYKLFDPYIRGAQTLGLVQNDGAVHVKGLKQNFGLHWSADLGLIIEKRS